MIDWTPMAERHPEEEWGWRGIVDPGIFFPDAYRIVTIQETVHGSCEFTAGNTCVANSTLQATTVNAAGAETFTWSGYVEGGEVPYKEDGTMTTATDGTRSLADVGDTPTDDTVSFNGQGAKFNGVDQTVENLPATQQQGTLLTTYKHTAGNSSALIFGAWSPNRAYIGINPSGLLSFGIAGQSYTTDGQSSPDTLVIGETYNIALTFDGTNATMSINVVDKATNTYAGTTANPLNVGIASFELEGIVYNCIYTTDVLTPTQIAYQFNNPEKFLYRDAGVLKSDTLSQAEIDNVVAYLPMCETGSDIYDISVEPPKAYPIANYTADVRDLANKLDKGLQTSALVRDALGVPTGIPSGTNHRELQTFDTAISITAPYTASETVIKDGVTTKRTLVDDGTTQTLYVGSNTGVAGTSIVNPVTLNETSVLDTTATIDERVSFAYIPDVVSISSGQGTDTIVITADDNVNKVFRMTCEATDTVDNITRNKAVTQEHTLAS